MYPRHKYRLDLFASSLKPRSMTFENPMMQFCYCEQNVETVLFGVSLPISRGLLRVFCLFVCLFVFCLFGWLVGGFFVLFFVVVVVFWVF